jgi:ferritin-like metal-binding protein YciE
MTKTHTTEQLLIVAMQDLADAELAWTERGAKLSEGAGPGVAEFLDRTVGASARQRERLVDLLKALGAEEKGDANIWLRAVLDDAERDIASTAAGPLRDIALIGAFRKGKQAERVSYETAIALADRLGIDEAASSLTACRDEEAEADGELAVMLGTTVERI